MPPKYPLVKLDSRGLVLLNPYSSTLYAYNKEGIFAINGIPNMSGLKVSKALSPFSKLFTAFAVIVTLIAFITLFFAAGLPTALEVVFIIGLTFSLSIYLARFRVKALEDRLSSPIKPYVEGELKARWSEICDVRVEEYDKDYDMGKLVVMKCDGNRIEIPLVNSPYEKAEELKGLVKG